MTLDDLRKDFMLRYPNLDYFTLNEIFKFGDMAYCLGVDDKNNNIGRAVIRSDGKQYKSVSKAARINKIGRTTILGSIREGWKAAGYNWTYA